MLNNKIVNVVAKIQQINKTVQVFAVNKRGQWTVLNLFMLPAHVELSDELYKEVDEAIDTLREGGHLPFIYQP